MEIFRGKELAERINELVERAAGDERIIVSVGGKQAVLVSVDDLAFLEEIDRKLDDEDVEEAKRRIADPAQASIPFTPGISVAVDRQ